jgi:predicted nuclease with TOPRIM domain
MTQATDERTFTEAELTAIVADRVARETANITTEVEQLRSEKTELENKLDAEISAKTAAEKSKADVEAEFEAFKKDTEEREQAAARKDERIKAVREAASHLSDDFFKDEKRIERIVAMKDDEFTGYVDDLKVTAGGAPKEKNGVPRETAMSGQQIDPKPESGTAARGFLGRHMATATKEA